MSVKEIQRKTKPSATVACSVVEKIFLNSLTLVTTLKVLFAVLRLMIYLFGANNMKQNVRGFKEPN
jgi:hypothetical protein